MGRKSQSLLHRESRANMGWFLIEEKGANVGDANSEGGAITGGALSLSTWAECICICMTGGF